MKVVIELHYLPKISYFKALSEGESVLFDIWENFQKQTFRNRCHIKSANKPVEQLVIPVKVDQGREIQNVRIDYRQKWNSVHLHAIRSAYGKAPYFEYYYPELEALFKQKPQSLVEFNLSLIKFCLKCLQFDLQVELTKKYTETYSSDVIDYRWFLDKKKPVHDIDIPVYQQIFGKEFESDLSVIDLIFCAGPEAGSIVSASNWSHPNKTK